MTRIEDSINKRAVHDDAGSNGVVPMDYLKLTLIPGGLAGRKPRPIRSKKAATINASVSARKRK